MSRHQLSIGASAFMLGLAASPALAVHNLPTIEVGGVKHRASRVSGPAPARRVAAPALATPSPLPAPPPAAATGNPAAPWSLDEARAPLTQPKRPDAASSVRNFSGAQVNAIPFAQPSDALEIVPGLLVAQHSGSGKANQYFLRGFALDHGNDLALWIDGMPINMPSHAHGQGYADANFVIPELFSSLDVRKGPYFADGGIFASAGQINMQYIDKLPGGLLSITGGSFGWARSVAAKSWAVSGGDLIAAVEANHYNGPWEVAENTKKLSSFIRWSQGTQANGFSITGMAYSNHWNATDQIPQRTVDQGLLSRWGTLDPTQHGNSARYSLSARWSQADETVGLSNGEKVGKRHRQETSAVGTVNTLVHVSRPLSAGAFVESVSIATQARTAAIMETNDLRDGPAITGTGTDCILIMAPEGDAPETCAGLHTDLGEAIGAAVYDATHAGATEWSAELKLANGIQPLWTTP